jgi:hypothetical protein
MVKPFVATDDERSIRRDVAFVHRAQALDMQQHVGKEIARGL